MSTVAAAYGSVAWVFVTLGVHVMFCRMLKRRLEAEGSRQKLFIALVGIMNIFLLLIMRSPADRVYAGIVYNALAYTAFCVYNMGETARRIRMVLEIRKHGSLSPEELKRGYSPEDQIRVRVERLWRTGQIQRNQENRWVLRSRLFLRIAKVLRGLRRFMNIQTHSGVER